MKTSLRIDYVSKDAAKYAVERWHYSRAMPSSKLVCYGCWEKTSDEPERFIGVVLYGLGASPHTYKQFGVIQGVGCELVRVALRSHTVPVTRIVSLTLRFLKRDFPRLRLVVSFADPYQGHVGGIYKAGNWLYTGTTKVDRAFIINGKKRIPRSVNQMPVVRGRTAGAKQLEAIQASIDPLARMFETPGKHRYVYPLDEEMRAKVLPLHQAYPVQRAGSAAVGTPTFPVGGPGSNPRSAHPSPQATT